MTDPASGRPLTRHPAFWVVVALLAAASITFSARYFAEAFPVAGVELEMDREGALEAARALAERHDWGPDGYRQAASFTDPEPEVRVYVELEAGEDDSLRRLREEGGYHPYRWLVRHFREGETREVTVRFTPAGAPWGFRLTIPEDEAGAALPPAEARTLAEEAAAAYWAIDPAAFELVESSQETRPAGRVDHTFLYRLEGVVIEDAEFRLRLRVAGDVLSEVTHSVRVPEAFSLRYAEMRTANTRLALGASFVFLALFLVVGCGGGIFYLLRTRWLEWRAPLAWGAVVATVMALAVLNQLPLAWMGYDTALPASTFLLQQLGTAAFILVVGTAFLAAIFMAAESLGRRAFPRHPQQWRFWNPDVARSGPILGRTVGGYLVAAIEIGFVVAFYMWAMRREGWWMPSEALIQPDLVASYFPWLTAVSIALFSGFWEESLFRAVPIAGAALIGARFGGKRWWILGALLLQAAVFAAAHADYPQQPSYARLAELFLPALFWGVLYIWFGLVPVILAHAGYNLTLISIPIWTSAAPGIWVDRALIIVLGLVPLWIVLYHIWRKGYRPELPEWAWHAAWTPPADGGAESAAEGRDAGARRDSAADSAAVGPEVAEPAAPGRDAPTAGAAAADRPVEAAAGAGEGFGPPAGSPPPPWTNRALLGCALVGGVLLLLGLRLTPDAPPLAIDRAEAESLAREALEARGIQLDEEWRALPATMGGPAATHRFVWEEGGPELYDALMGSYLREPGWAVRFARFTGPVEERAEQMRVELDARGGLWRLQHQLPEARDGASLEEEDARSLAAELLARELGESPAALEEVSAVATHRPDRRDWTFTWADEAAWPLERGDARLRVGLAGDALADRYRFVHTPEEWDREQQARSARMGILGGISSGFYFLLFGVGAVAGLVRWARGRFDLAAAGAGAAAAFLAFGLLLGNGLPQASQAFTTTQGYREQFLILAVGMGFGVAVLAAALGLNAGFVHRWARDAGFAKGWAGGVGGSAPSPAAAGIALGLLIAGLRWAAVALGPRDLPVWPSYGGAGSFVPFLAPVPSPAVSLIAYGLFLLLVLVGLDRFTAGWSRRRGAAAVGILLAGLAMPGPTVADAAWGWLLVGVVSAFGLFLLYRVTRTLGLGVIPWMVATALGVGAVGQLLFRAYPGAVVGGVLALVVLAAMAWGWARLLERPERATAVAPPVAAEAARVGG
jgi:membrane protease YdiL (CAAX protease family)